jgi:hypothetical protein
MNIYYFDSAVLCYVDGSFAYFTTQPLEEAWGDDWNDAPYEHNAGTPYGPFKGREGDWEQDGSPKWEIIKVAYDGWLSEARERHPDSPLSVQDINAGRAPWLVDKHGRSGVKIQAGTSLREFIELVKKADGEVYLPVGPMSLPERHRT